jgi:hypothetical protein
MPDTKPLYDEDFFRWTEDQAAALRQAARSGANLPLDWENLAEEVESLGASEKRELYSRIARIIEHLLKLEHSRARNPRRGWQETIARERLEIEHLLETSPSLKRQLPRIVRAQAPKAARMVSGILFGYGEADRRLPPPGYTVEQVLGDWFPAAKKR